MNFISIGFWAAFCAFFLLYIFVKRWSRTAMLLWVLAFDLFFFWQANGWLMLLLPATAAMNYFLTEEIRRSSRRMTGTDYSRASPFTVGPVVQSRMLMSEASSSRSRPTVRLSTVVLPERRAMSEGCV